MPPPLRLELAPGTNFLATGTNILATATHIWSNGAQKRLILCLLSFEFLIEIFIFPRIFIIFPVMFFAHTFLRPLPVILDDA